MAPMPDRFLASMAVKVGGRTVLFDAGEGTQIAWKRAHLGMRGWDLLAVTHLHADHVLGIPGLLMLRAQVDDPGPLTLVGPPGLEEFVRFNIELLEYVLTFQLDFVEWPGDGTGVAYADDTLCLHWAPLQHTRFCLGYRLEEPNRPGRFDPQRAKNAGVPEGPLWGRLQHGETVITPAGDTVHPEQILGPDRRGRRVAYVVDTRPTNNILNLCSEADLAVLEGMFLPEDAHHAAAKGHMTVTEAASLALWARVSRALLTHISPRYTLADLPRLEAAARAVYNPVRMGRDLDQVTIPLPD